MTVDTGDATPKKQPVRRVPFVVRQELAKQLEKMQREGVIKPSSRPWASALVLVRKRMVDYEFVLTTVSSTL